MVWLEMDGRSNALPSTINKYSYLTKKVPMGVAVQPHLQPQIPAVSRLLNAVYLTINTKA